MNFKRQLEVLSLGLGCLILLNGRVNAPAQGNFTAAQVEHIDIAKLPDRYKLDFERWRWAYQRRADPVHGIPSGAYLSAFEQTEATKLNRPLYATQSGQLWASIGPGPLLGGQIEGTVPPNVKVSGRITGIAIDPSNTNHWFVSAAGGGIWESRDAGVSWTPRTDDQPSLEMSALAGAPGDPLVIYGGTGNYGGYVPT